MIPIALLEKFDSLTFNTGIEIGHMTRHSSKPNKLRNVNPVRGKISFYTVPKRCFYCGSLLLLVNCMGVDFSLFSKSLLFIQASFVAQAIPMIFRQ